MSGVLPDWMIERDIKIIPFAPQQARPGVISYGVTSYGYDVRVDRHFKVFTNARCAIVDPKNFDRQSFVDIEGDYCLIPPNSFALAETIEYLEIPRDIIGVCLGKSTYARCFRGDTQVALADGSAARLEDMAAQAAHGTTHWGYSVGPSGRTRVARLEAPRFVGVDSLIEIGLSNGQVIRATPDHDFLLRDGTPCQAQFLRPGFALLKFQREQSRRYQTRATGGNSRVNQGHQLDRFEPENGTLREIEKSMVFWSGKESYLRYKSQIEIRGAEAEPWFRQHGSIAVERFETDGALGMSPAGEPADAVSGNFQNAEVGMTQFNQNQTDFVGNGTKAASWRANKRTNATTVTRVRDLPGTHDVYCLTVPETGNFALEAGVVVHNCGIICNVTPLEPEWRGRITIEISNTTPLPAKIYSGEGIAQILFFRGEELCKTSYADKKGKYQDQPGLTLPFVPRSEENGS